MTDLLEALYRGDDERVSELLAGEPELNVFEAAAFGRTERLRELLDRLSLDEIARVREAAELVERALAQQP